MNGIFEVVVHFSKFKNIDLFRQGLYCIRATLYSEKPEDEKRLPVGEGMPYYLLNEKKVHERISQNKKIVYASKISDSHRAFYSKTFRVQYVDQEVDLEDACLFRFERNAKARSDNCYLALELLFAEYNSTDYAMRKEYPSQEDFEMVSLKWLTINKFKAGHGSGFYPSTFDDSHFCLLDVMIHFMLIDYQFRQTTLTWRPPPGSGKTQVYELTCKTFEHSLFPKNLIKATGNAYSEREVRSIADKHHLNYITRLISAYNSLGRVADGLDPSAISPLEVPKQMLREKTPPTPPSPKTQAPTTPSKENEEGARTDGKDSKKQQQQQQQQQLSGNSSSNKSTATNHNAITGAQSQAKASSGGGGGGGGDAKKRSKPLPPLKAAKKRFAFPSLSRFSKRILWDDDPKAPSCIDLSLIISSSYRATTKAHTEGDIGEMGGRLASEIVEFIVENCPLGFKKLSIVAHSLGGLIARAALAKKEMEPYLSRLHTFMSLASPHCGYMYSKNTVLETGIWVLKKWSKSLCLTQLSMTDDPNPEKCFVYKLSKQRGLEHFQNCLLLASQQDYYSPFHSSLSVCVCVCYDQYHRPNSSHLISR
eukprot:jgi/Bigna1/91625/estExt_fgenesh1_pg.C_1090045